MKNGVLLIAFLLLTELLCAQEDGVHVEGSVNVGISTDLYQDQDKMDLVYSTNDPRLGTNSGNQYVSSVNDVSRKLHAVYGLDLDIQLHPNHVLSLVLEGAHDYERALGTRTEILKDCDGNVLEKVSGSYNRPNELGHDVVAGLDYTYRLRRRGETLSLGYRYQWENEAAGLEQEMEEASGWAKYTKNELEQKITYQYHHAHLDYVCPVAKGHLLDFGLVYNRRELSVRTEQYWDNVRVLDTDYRHLMQYGGIHARYRLRLGPVEAMARLEYRATMMQNRWLHDVLPTATVRYHIDTIHSLSAFYTIVLIRPDAQHLDTTHVAEAYTQRFGKDEIVGIHVHNVALNYQADWKCASFGAELRYLTTTDGFNAIWMERGNQRIYTWGNEGVRHAVSLRPSVDGRLSATTDLHADITVLWDKRIAGAINLENANWGVRANARLNQRLTSLDGGEKIPNFAMFLVLRGDYEYHNTLDVYSYAGHGGAVGADLKMAVKSVNIALGYSCLFKPDVHIVQGAYVGSLVCQPGATHTLALKVTYDF